ncbi:MAG TPA: FAD-dependent oxidoreductase [Steroidobacteraceae bacterium]|nr:FAD-dependent oxidoreductase [Steroidobacteraceae bacterium]
MQTVDTDVLVIGGGSAALRAALEAARSGVEVLLVDKGSPGTSGSSPVALVGFSGMLGDEADSEQLFLQDWVRAAGGICDRNLVLQVIRQGRDIVQDLQSLGVEFISNPDGSLFLSRRAGHSARRTVMVKGHANAMLPVRQAALKAGVRIREGVMVTRVLQTRGRAVGAMGVSAEGEPIVFRARATVIAAGGANRLYTNLCEEVVDSVHRTCGDSYALAFHAGVPLIDMEFTQFRDSPPAGPIFGAQYLNALGERVMLKYDPVALECAPRATMARAVYMENMEGRGPVVWNVEADQVKRSRAPVGQQYVAGMVVPITLMFQRLMGGARIDEHAATALPGLFAAGESSGGVQGGDRMQGCGFCETQVFGAIAGRSAAALARQGRPPDPDAEQVESERARLAAPGGHEDPAEFITRVQQIAWEKAGVVGERGKLAEGARQLESLRRERVPHLDRKVLFTALEAANLALTAELVARAKLAREESRSAHHRSDFPATDERWTRHVTLVRGGDDVVQVGNAPVVTAAP